jgi:hypothetical protein
MNLLSIWEKNVDNDVRRNMKVKGVSKLRRILGADFCMVLRYNSIQEHLSPDLRS